MSKDISDNELFDAINQLTGYKNGNHKRKQKTRIAGGYLIPIAFQGEDERWREHYVFVRRDRIVRAYRNAGEILSDYASTIAPWADPEYVKLLISGGVAIFFGVAIVAFVFMAEKYNLDSKLIGVLTGIFGTAFGFVVGKSGVSAH